MTRKKCGIQLVLPGKFQGDFTSNLMTKVKKNLSYHSLDGFHDPLGLENGIIPDSSLTASSSWNTDAYYCPPQRVRLWTVGELSSDLNKWLCAAWLSLHRNRNQWIQVSKLQISLFVR